MRNPMKILWTCWLKKILWTPYENPGEIHVLFWGNPGNPSHFSSKKPSQDNSPQAAQRLLASVNPDRTGRTGLWDVMSQGKGILACICTCTCMNVCICIYIYVCVYEYTNTCTCLLCLFIYIYVYIYTCMCVYVYTCVCVCGACMGS